MTDILPKEIIKGFYRHYKHNPALDFNNYMYEVVGIGRNTEEINSYTVLYRPLYENTWMPPADYQSRPYTMFIEDIVKDGVTMPRFTHVTDEEMISKLNQIKRKMYGH